MKPPLSEVADARMVERFWSKVEKSDDGCWLWQAARRRRGGYGVFTVCTSFIETAHRVAYQLTYGDVPAGTVICHHCDNPPCVRPDHLFAGTQADNVRDRDAKGRQARGARLNAASHEGVLNGRARLSEAQVLAIRQRHANGERQAALAREFNVTPTAIRLIASRARWPHLGEEAA